ncbi:diaphanous-related formin [Elysia marginata]|uniref:Diaphanous-related formin n=1 Tax=Elysia marginata TaxID=1093978 RepID=A0AAV4HJG4_9GAST|nr:diaphanous-related formin [Elysia marginata]
MDKKDKDKNRNSFLDKVGGTFKVGGKTKKKSTSGASNKGPQIDENDSNDPFVESVDFDSMAASEVNERFEQLLVSDLEAKFVRC